jgi:hypothetical protein
MAQERLYVSARARRNAVRAVRAGRLTEDAARAWLERLEDGPFLASFTVSSSRAERRR